MASSDGSTRGSTSSTFATDITNTVSTTRKKSSSSRALTAPTKRTRHVFRQTSLTFGPLSSSPVSTSSTTCASTPLFSDETDVSSSALIETRPSSPLATSPSVGGAREGVDHDKMDLDDEEDAQDPEQDESTNKRRRLLDAFDSPRLVSSMDLDKGKRKMETMYTMSGTQMSVFKAAQRRALGFKTIPGHVSARPILSCYVSNNEEQVYRCPSTQPYRNFAPPFALHFSHSAKAGGRQILAIADEEGAVNLIDAGQMGQWNAASSHASFQAHNNAIFDLAWSADDSLLATASGDQTVKLFDTGSQECVADLVGHTCTIKNVAWDPRNPHLLSTASRDGSIRLWDRRVAGADGSIATVNMIKNAHAAKGKGTRGRSAIRSVTAVAYLPQAENRLASSGSADSVIKVWDLRKSHSRRVYPAHVESNEEAVANTEESRPHGISSMTLAPDQRTLYALSKDHSIYAFDPYNLTQATPLRTFSHNRAQYGTFYIRVAVSPCSRYLASGSSDCGVYLWDAAGDGRDGVRLLGHEKETSGLDWGHDKIASCADDSLVRVWGYARAIAQKRARGDDKEVGWRWSGQDDSF